MSERTGDEAIAKQFIVWRDRAEAAESALQKIAMQQTSDEHIAEHGEYFVGDYEEGYDAIIKIARDHLASVGTPGK